MAVVRALIVPLSAYPGLSDVIAEISHYTFAEGFSPYMEGRKFP